MFQFNQCLKSQDLLMNIKRLLQNQTGNLSQMQIIASTNVLIKFAYEIKYKP